MIIPLCLQNVSIVARNAIDPDDNNGYCSSNEVFGVDVRLGEHVCQLYVLPRLGLSLIAVALLFGVPELLIARCQKEWFFLIVGFEPVFYHRND
ncbi:hypothetical protein [Slackia isoflavoniconvertens]|uniref:hypothetical protein n=1 Tax=Slackia isoflavoniconvertens TaxID=572010 RepID=UPI003AF17AD3